MGINQAKIDCKKCGCMLEMPHWEKFDCKFFTQWAAKCQNPECGFVRTVTLRKDLRGKSNERE